MRSVLFSRAIRRAWSGPVPAGIVAWHLAIGVAFAQPSITFTTPSIPGEFLRSGGIVAVSGRVDGASAGSVLTVNGIATPLLAGGRFEQTVPLDRSKVFNPILAELHDGGAVHRGRTGVFVGNSLGDGDFVTDGVAFRLTESAIQSVISTVGAPLVLSDVLRVGDEEPLFEDGCLGGRLGKGTFLCGPGTCFSAKLWLESVGAVTVDVDVHDAESVLTIEVTDLAGRFDTGCIGTNCTGGLTLESVEFRARIAQDVDPVLHEIRLRVLEVDVDVPGEVDFDPDSQACELNFQQVQPFLNTSVADSIIKGGLGDLEEKLNDVLRKISFPSRVTVGEEHVYIDTRFGSIVEDEDGVSYTGDLLLNSDTSLLRRSLEIPGTPPVFGPTTPGGRAYDLALSVSMTALNQLLKSLATNPALRDLHIEISVDIAPGVPLRLRIDFNIPFAPVVTSAVPEDGLVTVVIPNVVLEIRLADTPDAAPISVIALDATAHLDLVLDVVPAALVPRLSSARIDELVFLKPGGSDAMIESVLRDRFPETPSELRDLVTASNDPDGVTRVLSQGFDLPRFEEPSFSFLPVEVLRQGQFVSLFVRLANRRPQATGRNVDAVLIIDSSGSMGSNDPQRRRVDASKAYLVASLLEDQVGVVDFDSQARVAHVLARVGSERMSLAAALDTIDASGGTNIGEALRAGCELLGTSEFPDQHKAALLLTDGVGSYDGEDSCFVDEGWPVHTFALGDDTDEDLLSDIADRTGGEFQKLSDVTKLVCEFQRVRAGVDPQGCRSTTVRPGETQSITVPVGPRRLLFTFSTSWFGSDVVTTLVSPSGRRITRDTVAPDVTHDLGSAYEVYSVSNPEPGTWIVELFGADVPADGEAVSYTATTLAGPDGDGDDVGDIDDACPASRLARNLDIDGCMAGVPNALFTDGCTMADHIAACARSASRHGDFVQCTNAFTNEWKRTGTLSGKEKGAITACVARADF